MGKSNWTDDQLLQVSGAFWATCALHTGVKLEIFTWIGDELLSAEEVADRCHGDARAVGMLLTALTAMGLLVKQEDKFLNTPSSKTYLVKTSPEYLGYMILHHHNLMIPWAQLPQTVLSGRQMDREERDEEGERESFLMGMFNLASRIAPVLSKQINLGGKQHLLDLGGGPGTYAIHFCLANLNLRATVFDLPTTQPFALKTIDRFNLSNRVDFAAGDYLVDDIPGSYDAAWLSHILQSLSPDEAQMVVGKAAATLKPGGLLFIHEFILDDTLDGPAFPALFALNMLINTPKGQSYARKQLSTMLVSAGLSGVGMLPFHGPNDSRIIYGVK
ncbi:MAG: methyltransferase domain-containing protein [Deltaproteobacteria bacterium]|nr:methyltransferase domain-containing protein [Deltaproteobacteria bacterium]